VFIVQDLSERLPATTEVRDDLLDGFTDESNFVALAASLVVETAKVAAAAAEIRLVGTPVLRNQGIAVGMLLHGANLANALSNQLRDGHDGSQQLVVNRQLIELHANINYLCENGSPQDDHFEAYVNDSLVAERALESDIRAQIQSRGGEPSGIEARMQSSISTTTSAAAIDDLGAVPSRRLNRWPTAEVRIGKLGAVAYSSYRLSSSVLHSAFTHIEKNYWLNADPDDVRINYRPIKFKPQALEAAAFHLNRIIAIYVRAYLPGLPVLEQRILSMETRVRAASAGHERFLARQA
jgi:hypothetical protein